jgi:hypothetical protein
MLASTPRGSKSDLHDPEGGELIERRISIEASTRSEWVARCLERPGHEVIVADPSFALMYAGPARGARRAGPHANALHRADPVAAAAGRLAGTDGDGGGLQPSRPGLAAARAAPLGGRLTYAIGEAGRDTPSTSMLPGAAYHLVFLGLSGFSPALPCDSVFTRPETVAGGFSSSRWYVVQLQAFTRASSA